MTVAHYALLTKEAGAARRGYRRRRRQVDAGTGSTQPLAFDHDRILSLCDRPAQPTSWNTRRSDSSCCRRSSRSVSCSVCTKRCSAGELDKRNFRRKMALLEILTPLQEWEREGQTVRQQHLSILGQAIRTAQRPRNHLSRSNLGSKGFRLVQMVLTVPEGFNGFQKGSGFSLSEPRTSWNLLEPFGTCEKNPLEPVSKNLLPCR